MLKRRFLNQILSVKLVCDRSTICIKINVSSINITISMFLQFYLQTLFNMYEGCSLVSVIGFVTRKSALQPESQH